MKKLLLSLSVCTPLIAGFAQATTKIDFENEIFRLKSTAPNKYSIYMCYDPKQTTKDVSSKWHVDSPDGKKALTIATCDLDNGGILIHNFGAYTGAKIDDEITAFLWELSTAPNWKYPKLFVWMEPGDPNITAANGTLSDKLANPLFRLLTEHFGFAIDGRELKNAYHNSRAPALMVPARMIQLVGSADDVLIGRKSSSTPTITTQAQPDSSVSKHTSSAQSVDNAHDHH